MKLMVMPLVIQRHFLFVSGAHAIRNLDGPGADFISSLLPSDN
jgi:hypothetical protein